MGTLYLDCTQGARKDSFAIGVGQLLSKEERQRIAQAAGADQTQADDCCGGDHHHHHHHSVSEVREKIAAKQLTAAEREAALGVYDVLAQAEAKAHGVPVDEVHFHEVGSDEAITWVCIACASVLAVGADDIAATPVCTGFGFVDCAHGTLPIPAPATAHALEGAPTFSGDVEGELTTPTGAALVGFFATSFCDRIPDEAALIANVGA